MVVLELVSGLYSYVDDYDAYSLMDKIGERFQSKTKMLVIDPKMTMKEIWSLLGLGREVIRSDALEDYAGIKPSRVELSVIVDFERSLHPVVYVLNPVIDCTDIDFEFIIE